METVDEALRTWRRQALRATCGLTVFWLVLAYPIVITVGWGDWAFFVVLGWAAMGFIYFQQRRRIRTAAVDSGAHSQQL